LALAALARVIFGAYDSYPKKTGWQTLIVLSILMVVI